VRRSICLTADSTARANRTNLFCLVVLVVDDAVTVLVEVVDKILSLFSGAISKQSLCRMPCQSKVSACLKRFNDPPPCANSPLSDTNREFPDVHRGGNFVDDVPNSVMPI